MNKTFLMGLALLSVAAFSCTSEDDDKLNTKIARTNTEIDVIADDVSAIAEEQFVARMNAGRLEPGTSALPSCATVTITMVGEVWTSNVNFGSGCTLTNGNSVTGTMIISGSTNFDSNPYIVTYAFDNFYHNGRRVEGNRTVSFTRESTAAQAEQHTVANVDLNLVITYPGGNSYTRTGHRIRELIQGYDTAFDWSDNVYQVTGEWQTQFPTLNLTTTVVDPLVYYASCPYIGAGTLQYSTPSDTATLDFGDGTCDYFATLIVNGGSESTVLLN